MPINNEHIGVLKRKWFFLFQKKAPIVSELVLSVEAEGKFQMEIFLQAM